ncbi:MAG: hypothetical protein J0L92_12125 [Deltaproteobacteria bacterium]|nr:hypothetical protein [Deltaproteobacteria bacterium]
MTEGERIDDAWSFYERSLGTLTSGNDEDADAARPSALYLATNIPESGGVESSWDGAGWVEVAYGVSGNVSSFTVHGECHDVSTDSCVDDLEDSVSDRITALRAGCTCADEQHYNFAWDELNRLVDARRYDRPGTGTWTGAARMRYRYDGANQRGIKEVITSPMSTGGGLGGGFGTGGLKGDGWTTSERITLYVYPGDYERRGLQRSTTTYLADTTDEDATETQYLVAGARIVWAASADGLDPLIDNNRRATINVTDLLGTTGAVIDLISGDVVEASTYYPNGARENLWTSEDSLTPLEPMGFTTKEADEEIGMTYFGERWLIPRLGRWATPDPLHIHASGGGEALNSYHYVAGNILDWFDAQGLGPVQSIGTIYVIRTTNRDGVPEFYVGRTAQELRARFSAHRWARLLLNPRTTVVRMQATAELDVQASAGRSVSSALGEARRGAEQTQLEAERLRAAGQTPTGEELNEVNAAAPRPGGAQLSQRHRVTLGPEESLQPRQYLTGPRLAILTAAVNRLATGLSVVLIIRDADRIARQLRGEVTCRFPPYQLTNARGTYVLSQRANMLGMGQTTYHRIYLNDGFTEQISEQQYGIDMAEGEALWGGPDGEGGFTPGLANPYPDDEMQCTPDFPDGRPAPDPRTT